MRAPGLTWFRLPLFIWSLYATSIILFLATPVLAMTSGAGSGGTGYRRWHLRPESGWRPVTVSALVLVLLAPGRLRDDFARYGCCQRDYYLLFTQKRFWISLYCVRQHDDRLDRFFGLGASHVRCRAVGLRGAGVFHSQLPGSDPLGDQGLQLDCHALPRLDSLRGADALCAGLYRTVHHWRI